MRLQAFAEAEAKVCVVGEGEAKAYQSSLAQSIVNAYAEAVVVAIAVVKAGKVAFVVCVERSVFADGTAGALVKAKATSEVETEDTFADTFSGTYAEGDDAYADATGSASASATIDNGCAGTYLERCCDHGPFGLRSNCFCGRGYGFCSRSLSFDAVFACLDAEQPSLRWMVSTSTKRSMVPSSRASVRPLSFGHDTLICLLYSRLMKIDMAIHQF